LKPLGCIPVPLVHGIQRPLGRLVRVAIAARVGSAELHRLVGARNADAVISTRIDDHVRARWHVTFDALRARRSDFVEMMLWRIVLLSGMALHTNVVAGGADFETVRFVAIAAGHAGMEHPALDERAVFVVLLLYLSIRVIEVLVEKRHAIVISRRLSVHVVFV